VDVSHCFVEKRHDDVDPEGQDFSRCMRDQEVCTGVVIHRVHLQIDAVGPSSDTTNASEPASAESCNTTIQSSPRLIEFVVRMV
jgi:hypothetical protein